MPPGYKWLEVVPGRRGGRLTVKGTRIAADDILEMLAAGWTPEEVAEEYEIPLEAVYEALKFASKAIKRGHSGYLSRLRTNDPSHPKN